MKKKSVGADFSMCVQPTFLVGTYQEDGTPNFAPITWVSVTCGAADTFFCKIKNVQIDETLDILSTWGIDLTKLDPVVYSGQYFSLEKRLGKIGDFYSKK